MPDSITIHLDSALSGLIFERRYVSRASLCYETQSLPGVRLNLTGILQYTARRVSE